MNRRANTTPACEGHHDFAMFSLATCQRYSGGTEANARNAAISCPIPPSFWQTGRTETIAKD